MPRYEELDTQRLRKLAAQAERGNDAAQQELWRLNRRYARMAQKRLNRIEESGLPGGYAVDQARYYLGSADAPTDGFFTSAKIKDVNILENQLEAIARFLRSGTTATRIRRQQSAIQQRFKEDFTGKDGKLNKAGWAEFGKFLKSGVFENMRKADSGRVVNKAIQMIQNGATADDFIKAYNRYLSQEEDYEVDVWKDLEDEYLDGSDR